MFVASVVAIGTLGLPMPANEFEVGEVVIEGVLVETDDIRIAAQVVGMAGVALGVADVRVPAMKTIAGARVGRYVFVAVHAQVALGALIE